MAIDSASMNSHITFATSCPARLAPPLPRDIHRSPLRERLRSVSKPAMAFFWVYERPWLMVGGVVAPAGLFLAGHGGVHSRFAHNNGPPAGVFGFTGGGQCRAATDLPSAGP